MDKVKAKNNHLRHPGTIDINFVKASEAYQRRIDQGKDSVWRKYAICFGYLGSNYQGLQINPDAETIEAQLELALFLCGGLQESNYGFFHKVQWTRTARTDRGVHAATQCCAMKLNLPVDKRELFISQLNSFLPPDIRAHCMTKVTGGFNAKNACSSRRYHYLLPTYMLQSDLFSGYSECNEAIIKAIREQKAKGNRVSGETLQLLRNALKLFEGTHHFHNFTTGLTSADDSSKRYILQFECASEPFVAETGVEYVILSVLGASFLLNQIRKMVAIACDVARGVTGLETIPSALKANVKANIPMAPGVGLYLAELHFDAYNDKLRRENEQNIKAAKKKAEQKAYYEAKQAAKLAAAAKLISADPADADQQSAEKSDSGAVTEIGTDDEENAIKKQRLDDLGNSSSSGDNSNITSSSNINAATLSTATKPAKDCGTADQSSAAASSLETTALHEELDWSSNDTTRELITNYCNEHIHPHIYAEEETSLHFMHHLYDQRKFVYKM